MRSFVVRWLIPILLILLIWVGVGLLFMGIKSLEDDPDADLNLQAPLVVETNGLFCTMSPSRTYVSVTPDDPWATNTLYDVRTGQPVVIDWIPSHLPLHSWVWLANDVRFYFTPVASASVTVTLAVTPTQIWLVDIPHQLITDVLSLPLPQQAQLLAAANHAFLQLDAQYGEQGGVSPNGKHIAIGGTIWDYFGPRGGRSFKLNGITYAGSQDCIYGWKLDSSGVYFVDSRRRGLKTYGGPIRFLPVVPMK